MRQPGGNQSRTTSPEALALRDTEAARKLGLHRDTEVAELMGLRLLLPHDAEIAELLQQHIADARLLDTLDPNPFRATAPTAEEVGDGEILLGHAEFTGAPVMLTHTDLTEGVAILGSPGSGKTCSLYVLIAQLLDQGFPVLIPDFKKDYRHLLPMVPSASELVEVYQASMFPCAPLSPPPGMNPRNWVATSAGIIAHAWGLQSASIGLYSRLLDHLYEDRGIYDGGTWYPSIEDLVYKIQHPPFRLAGVEYDYRARLLERLEQIRIVLPELARRNQSLLLQEIIARPKAIVLELHDLNAYLQSYLVEVLMLYLLQAQLAQVRRGALAVVLVLDEATRVWDAQRERSEGMISPISLAQAQFRELGVGTVYAAQEPSKLSPTLFAATATKVALASASGSDVVRLGQMMNLDPDQAAYVHRLERAQGIVRKLRGYRDPFLMRVPNVQIDRTIATDEYVRARMAPIWYERARGEPPTAPALPEATPTPPPTPAGDIQARRPSRKPAERPVSTAPVTPVARQPAPAPPNAAPELSQDARRLLIEVCMNRWSFVTQHGQRIGLSGRKLETARGELEKGGWVEALPVRSGRQGGVPVLLLATEKAWAETRLEKPADGTHGGMVHTFWQRRIRAYYEARGAHADIEAMVGGKSVDVLVVEDGVRTGIEVQLGGDKHAWANLERDVALAGVDRVVLAFDSKAAATKAEKKLAGLPSHLADRVEVVVLGTFTEKPDEGTHTKDIT